MSRLPKYLQKQSPQKKGRKQEKKARKHINSGAVWFDKYDLSTKEFLIDVKRTEKESIKLSLQKLRELYDESVNQGKTGAMLIYIGDLLLQLTIKKRPKE